jgi:steroid delta-isomerase-like uncharacterized protein
MRLSVKTAAFFMYGARVIPMTRVKQGLVPRLVKALNRHDTQAVAALCAPDFRGDDCAQAGPQIGPVSLDETLVRYLQAFPDLILDEVETLVQEGSVAMYWTARGTHLGLFMNIPPTGKCVSVCGTTFFTLAEDKITYSRTVWDLAGLLRAIGLLPDL